jgi:hypothetical protein
MVYAIIAKNVVIIAKILKTFVHGLHGFSRINFFLSKDYPSKPDQVLTDSDFYGLKLK